MTNKRKEEILNLISYGKIEQALKLLNKLSTEIDDEDVISQIISISSRYHYNLNERNSTGKDVTNEQNSIIFSIIKTLKLIDTQNIDATSSGNSDNELLGSGFLDSTQANQIFNFKNRLNNIKQFDLIGYSCINFIRYYKSFIKKSICRGVEFRILIIKPNSEAFKMMNDHTKEAPLLIGLKMVNEELSKIREYVIENSPENINKLKIKYTTWIPSCSVIILNRDYEDAILKSKLYPIFHPTYIYDLAMFHVIEKKNNKKWFDYFLNQFENIWKYPDCTITNYKKNLDYKELNN